MSRIPHQAVPAEPIQEDMPVCAVNHRLLVFENSPRRLTRSYPGNPAIPRGLSFRVPEPRPISRHRSEARLFDMSWEYDCHGILGHRKPSGEV
jgi:hypothetical protein